VYATQVIRLSRYSVFNTRLILACVQLYKRILLSADIVVHASLEQDIFMQSHWMGVYKISPVIGVR